MKLREGETKIEYYTRRQNYGTWLMKIGVILVIIGTAGIIILSL